MDMFSQMRDVTRAVGKGLKTGLDKVTEEAGKMREYRVIGESFFALEKGVDVLKDGMSKLGIPIPRDELPFVPLVGDDAVEAIMSLPVILDPEAEAEKDRILSSLEPGYFDRDYDPLLAVLSQLPPNPAPEDFAKEVDRRQRYLDVVSEKLGHHVMKNYGDFVRGMNEVAAVDQALQMAHVVAKNARRALHVSEQQMARDLHVSSMSKKKQQLLELGEVLRRLAESTALRSTVKRAHESRDFASALLVCLECAQGLGSLDSLGVTLELRDSTENLMQETITLVDEVLFAQCKHFDPDAYRKVLEAYTVLGDVEDLATKLQAGFAEAILDKTQSAVRAFARQEGSVSLLKMARGPKGDPHAAAKLLSFPELVPLVPMDAFRACVARALEESFEVLHTHHTITVWQAEAAERGIDAVLAAPPVPPGGQQSLMDSSPALARKALARVESMRHDAMSDKEAMAELLKGVNASMNQGRAAVLETAVRRLVALLGAPAAAEPEHFIHILAWTAELMDLAASFDAEGAARLTGLVSDVATRHFTSFHRQNRDAARALLDKEVWRAIQSDLKGVGLYSMHDLLSDLATRSHLKRPFEDWLKGGNPFSEGGVRVHTATEIINRATERCSDPSVKFFTGSSIKVMRLLGTYVVLMDSFRDPRLALSVVKGLSEIFQFYMFWCFRLFGDLRALPELAAAAANAMGQNIALPPPSAQRHMEDGMTPRLREVLQGVNASMGTYLWEQEGKLGENAARAAQAMIQGSGKLVNKFVDAMKSDVFSVESELPPVHQGQGQGDLSRPSLNRPSMGMGGREASAGGPGHQRSGSQFEGNGGAEAHPQGGDEGLDRSDSEKGKFGFGKMAGLGGLGTKMAMGSLNMFDKMTDKLKQGVPGAAGNPISGDSSKKLFSGMANMFKDTPPSGPAPSGASASQPQPSRPSGINLQPMGDALNPVAALSMMKQAMVNIGDKIGLDRPEGAGGPGALNLFKPGGLFANDIVSSGNLFGMRERAVAAETLDAICGELTRSRQQLTHAIQLVLTSHPSTPKDVVDSTHHEVEALFRSVDAAADLREHLFRTGAQRLVQGLLAALPDRIASSNYNLHEMGTDNSAWVDLVVQQIKQTTTELAAAGLDPKSHLLTLESAVRLVELAMIEGMSRVRKCSVEGRALMSLDLGTLISGLRRSIGPLAQQSASLLELRLAESFIKAYYSPEEELERWIQTHPQFTRAQVEGLLNCMVEANKLQKRTAKQLLQEMTDMG